MKKIATPENIEKAREALIREHKEITAESIRLRMGGGSYNTILKYLRSLGEKTAAETVNAKDPNEEAILTEAGMQFIKSLYQICKERADYLAMSSFRSMQGITSEIEEKASRLDELEEKYANRAKAAETENKVIMEKLASAQKENQNLKDKLKEAKEMIESLKKENADYKKYQQMILQSYNVISEKLCKKTDGDK